MIVRQRNTLRRVQFKNVAGFLRNDLKTMDKQACDVK
jgi:hypothetical protein